ncbi:glucosamine-6-phosphate deaminase [Paenibacillus sp. 32O-W]|jgi:glucosamine-6-phosphate deaminase|uniref:Glucosamine-6-phosphate deaminase n=1 Tax=Paenibacillus cisolokensis TaxID=1658519 RepID=A0ABQ4NCA9_9BACL|nr:MULTISPECIES: glucosamine-6-phosphate deaminase [Paenibacillus]ALS26911.1 glucosamine-6-phosphate deaminase [Paenibacillus sp. 32O-W]GIQ65864.1 glucosamine-6-phosphate deaminase [Paenibacillus cisolokensis]
MEIRIFDDQSELDRYAASLFAETVRRKPDAVLGLATGSTPIGIYEKIVEEHRRGLSFREVTTFNLDEYVGLPRNHEQSYYTYMQKHLFAHIDIRPENVHLPNGTADDLAAECARYDALLAKHPIDIQLLGLGHNGHIGFNEPDESLIGETHVVELKRETLEANARFFASIRDVPTHAVTMGVGAILRAKTIVLAARGTDKARIVKEALQGPITTKCPASLLQTHAHVIVLLDREAGRELE